ncbi:MAG TPA: Hsp20 family protein [Ktedonobacteraceae bacterium]|nr:Hsp20 family protein [Ktedonobacteraceae bacterium]
MQEQAKIQEIPVKVYRTADRLMVAAPMPGLEPEDILVEITNTCHLLLRGQIRGVLKGDGDKELLVDEWSVGGYYRDVALPNSVDGEHANVNYGNGVIVIAMPLSERTMPAKLTMVTVGPARGERTGNSGHI